ncbi:uncharacterized protein Pyn_16498 [Prunus yedoensis var. nudiflora]|uniref:Uncharacterized protein n=1 Tax=Prunus yedoensis var. nudiflora TaxID=2094558 RepID=A0A314UCF6_PRUYE|nr:uncharacterized protein Pyn_16498 [Prunus yedoensis var. nudiflora]
MLGIPAEKAWEMYRDNDIINKINPEMLTSAEYIEGDGRPGSPRLYKLGPVTLSVSVCALFKSLHINQSYIYLHIHVDEASLDRIFRLCALVFISCY